MDEDGLEEGWDANKYLFNEGNHDCDDVHYYTGGIDVNYDSSGMGFGSDITDQLNNSNYSRNGNECIDVENSETNSNVIKVSDLSMDLFRKQLVDHFDICFKLNRIVWPTRVGSKCPEEIIGHNL